MLKSLSKNGNLVLPEVGSELFHFRLSRELGRGAFARVFLARQADLAGRPVVLKVSAIEGDEPQTLAQLQHTHIVPIHSVHEDSRAGLRVVCMPYFGGTILSRVLQGLWAETKRPHSGQQLVRALATAQVASAAGPGQPGFGVGSANPAPAGSQDESPEGPGTRGEEGASPLTLLSGLSYFRAAAWIVARLAEGLQHAHQRGVLHRDIKPSNILLGTDGQPMLLDFNLAQHLHDGQAQTAAVLGGTVAFMSPEHLRALVAKDPVQNSRVDQRSDIYSLGMVLYEMLTGESPFGHKGSYSALPVLIELMAVERSRGAPSLRQKRSDIPWGLESIARKCLAPDPTQRYQQAEHLAEDLRRFLEDRPLKYAPELSRMERLRKWARRHPRLTSSGSVAVVAMLVLLAAGAGLVGIRQHLARTQDHLEAAQAQERKQLFQAGTRRAFCLVNTTTDLQDHLRQGLAACRETLAVYGILDRDNWQEHPDWRRLAPAERRQLAEETRELLLLFAWAQVHTAPGDIAALKKAVTLLDKAQAIKDLAPSRALGEDRALYLERLKDVAGARTARAQARRLRPAGARDHYLLAASFARRGKYTGAIEELDQALQFNPRHYWSSFQRGICHQELGQHILAAGDFGTCIGLWPEFALGYFNRGYALDQGGHRAEAIRDYTAALERDPRFAPAYLNRGMAYLELKQYSRALTDFRHLVALDRDDAFVHAGRGVALEGLGRHQQADRAFRAAFTRAEAGPRTARTRIRWVYGFAVATRLPDKARAAFAKVLRHTPDHPQALYGLAMLWVEEGKDRQALPLLNKALEVSPNFQAARRCRAILLARCGNFAAASQDVNTCLEREPNSGAMLYAAACVAALAAGKTADQVQAQLVVDQALAFLEKAFARGYGRDKAARDLDLKDLRKDPRFGRLVKNNGGTQS